MSLRRNVLVVIYTFNHQDFISDCLRSVLDQDMTHNLLIRVHDDQSEDETYNIVSKFAARYPGQFSVSQSLKNSFPALPVIEDIQGFDYITYLDGDDFWTDKSKINKQVDFMERHPEISMSFHRSIEMKNGEILKDWEPEASMRCLQDSNVLRRGFYMPRSSIMRKAFQVEHEGYRGRILNYDEFIRVQASLHGGVGYVEEILPVVVRWHENNAWSGRDYDDQVVAQASSYYFIARWLRSKGLHDDARHAQTVAGGLMLGPDSELFVATRSSGMRARIKKYLFRIRASLCSTTRRVISGNLERGPD